MKDGDLISTAADRLLQYGVLGIVVIVFGAVIWFLWKDATQERKELSNAIRDLQLSRVDDLKASQAQTVEVVKQCTSALSNVTMTLETYRETMTELRDTLKDFGDELRRPRR